MMFRESIPLLAGLIGLAGCPAAPTRDADAEADANGPDPGDAADLDAADGADWILDEGGDRPDAAADVSEEAEGWDFGADLWDPLRNCDRPVEDPPAMVAPSCGEGCRQVAFAAEPWGRFAVSDRWLVYESRYRTWVVDLESGAESILFCHPSFVGSYGLGVDGDTVAFAIGTDFMVGDIHVNYAAIWTGDVPSRRWRLLHEWTKPQDTEMTRLAAMSMNNRYVVFSL